jgi:DNA-binding FadR family transcriptional regulator
MAGVVDAGSGLDTRQNLWLHMSTRKTPAQLDANRDRFVTARPASPPGGDVTATGGSPSALSRMSTRARAAVFSPLEPTGRAEAVARRLSDAIALGLLPDAEQLPSETDLAERLGVSTVTVREALTTLREHGLVVTRRGRGGGSFVRAPGDAATSVLRSRLRDLGLGELRDLADHYAAISGACARLAAERADGQDLARLAWFSERLATASDPGARRRAEGQHHLELAAAAQSPRLTREEVALQTLVGPVLWLPYSEDGTAHAACGAHSRLQTAIAAADAGAARSAAEQHVAEMFDAVRRLHRTVAAAGG